MRNKAMRIRVLLLVCLIVGLAFMTAGQESSDSAASTVRSLELKWADSYKQRQVGMLDSLLADDFIITVEDGTTFGKVGYISHTADSTTHVDVCEFSELKVRVHGNTAVVTGAYHESGKSGGKPYDYHDRFTDVWMKNNGKWQVIASHYSVPMK